MKLKSEVFDITKKQRQKIFLIIKLNVLDLIMAKNSIIFSFMTFSIVKVFATSSWTHIQPQQNAVAERFMATAADGIRTLLTESSLNQTFG